MRKMKYFKCPECGMKFTAMNGWAKHINRDHPGLKPKGFTDLQYLYYVTTGKTHGNCIQCHGETSWNETNGKYNRFCNNPNCKAEYTKMAKQRMVDKYGKQHLLNDPDMQRKMLKGKHISGTYKFSNNSGSVDYVGTYERDFLYIMDHVMGFNAGDIMGPSPHNYIYIYEGKARVYIPDFYIPNYNLEIEIKTDENMHYKIQAVDKVKEHLKDEMMSHNPSVNYFKILDKKYNDFFKYLMDMKFSIDDTAMEHVNEYLATGAKEAANLDSANESAKSEERTDFGIPELKKYPMPDEKHVKLAIRFFNYVEPEYEKELASNIIKYIKKYNMTDVNVGERNKFAKYYNSSAATESVANKKPNQNPVANKCIASVKSLICDCMKRQLDNNVYFKSPDFTQHIRGTMRLAPHVMNSKVDSNTGKCEIEMSISIPPVNASYKQSSDPAVDEQNYKTTALPVFNKLDAEFKNVTKAVISDFTSHKSEIEENYNCNIAITFARDFEDNVVVKDNGHGPQYSSRAKNLSIDFSISFNNDKKI